MSATPDIAGDFLLADGLFDIELTAGTDSQSGVKAILRQVSSQEVETSGGLYLSSDSKFIISDVGLTVLPVVGGTVTDDASVAFVVLGVQRLRHTHRYRIIARALSVIGTVTIQKKTLAKNDDGVTVPAWADETADVPAMIHERSAVRAKDESRPERMKPTFRIVFLTAFDTANRRIKGPDDKLYRIVADENSDDLGQLYSITAEEWIG